MIIANLFIAHSPFLVGDSPGDGSRGAEGRDEGRVLPRSSRHDDHDVPPVAGRPGHRSHRTVLEALGKYRGESPDVLRGEAGKGNRRLLPHLTAEVVLGPPRGGGGS